MIFPPKDNPKDKTKTTLYFIQLSDGTKALATLTPTSNKEFKTLVNPLRVENMRLQDGSFESFIVGPLNPAATKNNIGTIDVPVGSVTFMTNDVSEEFIDAYVGAIKMLGGDDVKGTIQ